MDEVYICWIKRRRYANQTWTTFGYVLLFWSMGHVERDYAKKEDQDEEGVVFNYRKCLLARHDNPYERQ